MARHKAPNSTATAQAPTLVTPRPRGKKNVPGVYIRLQDRPTGSYRHITIDNVTLEDMERLIVKAVRSPEGQSNDAA